MGVFPLSAGAAAKFAVHAAGAAIGGVVAAALAVGFAGAADPVAGAARWARWNLWCIGGYIRLAAPGASGGEPLGASAGTLDAFEAVVQQIVCKLSSELDVSDSFPSGDGA